jgi:type IV pilus assembly protein PilM
LRAILREIDLPFIPDEEIDSAIRFQAEEVIPFPPEKALLSSKVLFDYTGNDGRAMRRVLVAAAHRDLVDSVLAAVNQARLTPVSIDLASSALVATLATSTSTGQAEAIVSIGGGVTLVAIHEQGNQQFLRTIGQGGNAVSAAIAGALDIPPIDAESLKAQLGLPQATAEGGAQDSQLARAARAVEPVITDLISEIQTSLRYYSSMSGRGEVSRVVVVGSELDIPGLLQRIESELGLPIERGSVLDKVDASKTRPSLVDADEAAKWEPVLPAAVGMALGGAPSAGKGFNLIPPELLAEGSEKVVLRAIVAVAAVVILALAGLSAWRVVEVNHAQSAVDTAQKNLNALQQAIPKYNPYVQKKDQILAAQVRAQTAVAHEVNWITVLASIGAQLPGASHAVGISSFSANATTAGACPVTQAKTKTINTPGCIPSAVTALPPPSAVLGAVSISADTGTIANVSGWIDSMSASPVFTNVTVSSISNSGPATAGSPVQAVSFTSAFSITGSAHSTRLSTFIQPIP